MPSHGNAPPGYEYNAGRQAGEPQWRPVSSSSSSSSSPQPQQTQNAPRIDAHLQLGLRFGNIGRAQAAGVLTKDNELTPKGEAYVAAINRGASASELKAIAGKNGSVYLEQKLRQEAQTPAKKVVVADAARMYASTPIVVKGPPMSAQMSPQDYSALYTQYSGAVVSPEEAKARIEGNPSLFGRLTNVQGEGLPPRPTETPLLKPNEKLTDAALNRIQTRLDKERAYLEEKAGKISQYDEKEINKFNLDVDKYNASVDEARGIVDKYNASISFVDTAKEEKQLEYQYASASELRADALRRGERLEAPTVEGGFPVFRNFYPSVSKAPSSISNYFSMSSSYGNLKAQRSNIFIPDSKEIQYVQLPSSPLEISAEKENKLFVTLPGMEKGKVIDISRQYSNLSPAESEVLSGFAASEEVTKAITDIGVGEFKPFKGILETSEKTSSNILNKYSSENLLAVAVSEATKTPAYIIKAPEGIGKVVSAGFGVSKLAYKYPKEFKEKARISAVGTLAESSQEYNIAGLKIWSLSPKFLAQIGGSYVGFSALEFAPKAPKALGYGFSKVSQVFKETPLGRKAMPLISPVGKNIMSGLRNIKDEVNFGKVGRIISETPLGKKVGKEIMPLKNYVAEEFSSKKSLKGIVDFEPLNQKKLSEADRAKLKISAEKYVSEIKKQFYEAKSQGKKYTPPQPPYVKTKIGNIRVKISGVESRYTYPSKRTSWLLDSASSPMAGRLARSRMAAQEASMVEIEIPSVFTGARRIPYGSEANLVWDRAARDYVLKTKEGLPVGRYLLQRQPARTSFISSRGKLAYAAIYGLGFRGKRSSAVKTVAANKFKSAQTYRLFSPTKSIIKQRSATKQKQLNLTKTAQLQKFKMPQVQRTRLIMPQKSILISKQIQPMRTLIPQRQLQLQKLKLIPAYPLTQNIDILTAKKSGKSKRKKKKRAFAYTPSLISSFKGIRGRIPKAIAESRFALTGLEVRPFKI